MVVAPRAALNVSFRAGLDLASVQLAVSPSGGLSAAGELPTTALLPTRVRLAVLAVCDGLGLATECLARHLLLLQNGLSGGMVRLIRVRRDRVMRGSVEKACPKQPRRARIRKWSGVQRVRGGLERDQV